MQKKCKKNFKKLRRIKKREKSLDQETVLYNIEMCYERQKQVIDSFNDYAKIVSEVKVNFEAT